MVLRLSMLLASNYASRIFAATKMECLGKELLIDGSTFYFLAGMMGMGGCFHIYRIRGLQNVVIKSTFSLSTVYRPTLSMHYNKRDLKKTKTRLCFAFQQGQRLFS